MFVTGVQTCALPIWHTRPPDLPLEVRTGHGATDVWGEEAVYGWLGPLPRHSQGCSQNASWLTLLGEGLTGKTGSRPELTPVTEWLGTPASQWLLAGSPLGY